VESIAKTLAELSILALAEAEAGEESEIEEEGRGVRKVGGESENGSASPVMERGVGSVGNEGGECGSEEGSESGEVSGSGRVSESGISSRGTTDTSVCTKGSGRRTWHEVPASEIAKSASCKTAPKKSTRRLPWLCKRPTPVAEVESDEEGVYVVPAFDIIR